jgi:hypothetical protein
MSFTVKTTVSNQKISDQFVAAFEGGSLFWMGRSKRIRPEGDRRSDVELCEAAGLTSDMAIYPLYFFPLVEGFGVQIELDDEGQANGDTPPALLNRQSIQRGLDWLAEHHPSRIAEILEETGDAETGDVFLQACVFGEIVYG